MTSPIVENSLHLTISTSVGIARSDYDCDSVESLMRRADIAMYCAKNQGRNRHSWFDASMERELNVRNSLEAGMREGIPLGQFVPYYEQQVDLGTRSEEHKSELQSLMRISYSVFILIKNKN